MPATSAAIFARSKPLTWVGVLTGDVSFTVRLHAQGWNAGMIWRGLAEGRRDRFDALAVLRPERAQRREETRMGHAGTEKSPAVGLMLQLSEDVPLARGQ